MFFDKKVLFDDLYIQNIRNRFKEIDSPSNEDKIRWPMELIQNAKDSLYLSSIKSSKQEQVSITIEIQGNLENVEKVIFSHDGPPFTEKSYVGLMYKVSQGKENKKTAGRFGTGFLTTHVLSKTVEISGDIIHSNEEIKGFSVTMYREGNTDKEILANFDKMEESYKEQSETNKKTTFIYSTKTNQSKECAKLGIINLKNHISDVLINCPDIKCITLIENGKKNKFSASCETKDKEPNIYSIKSTLNKEPKKYLTLKNDKANISVEINDAYEIIPKIKNNNIVSLYAYFPLYGTELHILPFSLNSPNFEPTIERNALQLLSESDCVNANRNIFLSTLKLYEKLIDELKNKNCPNIQELSYGLKMDKIPYKTFDLVWYEEKYLEPMRSILSKNVTIKTNSNESVLLSDVFFPNEIKEESIERFLNLSVLKKYFPNMICYEDYIKWKDFIWTTPKSATINDLIEKVRVDNSLFEEPAFKSFNEVISFAYEHDTNLLYNQAFIPNMNNELKCLSFKDDEKNEIILKECKKVSDEIIQIIEAIEIPWKSTHVNNLINSIKFNEDDEISAENKILDKIKKLVDNHNVKDAQKFSYCLMKFILKDNVKREKMFQLATKFDDFPYKDTDKVIVTKVNPIIWKNSDDFILNKIIEIIQKYDSENIKNNMDYIKESIFVFNIHFEPDVINSLKIIPNAKNELKCLNELKNQSIQFHDHFSSKIKELFDIDLDEQIIHPEINKIIKSKEDEELRDFLKLIDEKINVDEFEKFILIAELVLSIIPTKNAEQKEIFNVYKHFKPTIDEILVDDDLININYYNKVNKIIQLKICKLAEESGTLQNFQDTYKLNEEESFKVLNLLYDKLGEDLLKYKIIPNKKGQFMLQKELRNDPKIDEKIFDLFIKLGGDDKLPEEQKLNSPEKIIHPNVIIIHPSCKIADFQVNEFNIALFRKISSYLLNPKADKETLDMINELMDIDISNVGNDVISEDQKLRMDILHNMHIAFIGKRIRELIAANSEDFQRWPFELIQNATDCIQNPSDKIHNKKMNGHMIFEFKEKEVVFTHYGAPFTQNNLVSLLYQYSDGKYGKSKIGRFGTGFLSTMVLTRYVEIDSDIQDSDDVIKGFHVVIDRSGDGEKPEELKKYIHKMEQSLRRDLDITFKTQFVFKLPDDEDENPNCYSAYNDGYKSLIKYAAPSLIFNPKIKSITVKKDDDDSFVFSLEKDDDDDNIKKIKVKDLNSEESTYRHFIYHNTLKTYNDKNVKIECLLEIEPESKGIIPNEEFLFLQFPMFGEKAFQSPFIINSPDFEAKTERNNIIINSKKYDIDAATAAITTEPEKDDDKHQDSLSLINKFIIQESVKLFGSIIESIKKIGCTDIFNICYGLTKNSTSEFYQKEFIEKIRNKIIESPIFEYSPGKYDKCENIIIPYIQYPPDVSREDEKRLYKNFYDLTDTINIRSKSLMKYFLCLKWNLVLWSDFKSKFTIKDLLGFISEHDTIDDLPFKNKKSPFSKKEEFIGDVIQFVQDMKKIDEDMLFARNRVFLNKNKQLVCLADIYEYDWNDEAKSMILHWMDIVNYDYQRNMLSDGLKKFYKKEYIKREGIKCKYILFDNFTIDRAIHLIEDRIDERNAIDFMNYLYKTVRDDGSINNKRGLMYEFSRKLLDFTAEKVQIHLRRFCIEDSEFDILNVINNMFSKADFFVFEKLILKLHDLNVQKNIEFIKSFVGQCKESLSSNKFEECEIIPNKNFKLCKTKDLAKDFINNEELKSIIKNQLGLDLNDELAHDEFAIFVNNKMNINDSSNKILDSISKQKDDFYKLNKCDLFKIVLQHSINENYKDIILSIFKFFYKIDDSIQFKSESEQYFSFNLTTKIIELILNDLIKCVSLFNNIQEFAYCFKKCRCIYDIFDYDISKKTKSRSNNDKIYDNLSNIYHLLMKYELLKIDQHKIFPNSNGDLQFLTETKIFYDLRVDNEKTDVLFDLLGFLIRFDYSKGIEKIVLSQKIPIKKEFNEYFKDYIINLDWFVDTFKELYEHFDGEGSLYKDVHRDFVQYIDDNITLRAVFSKLLDQIKDLANANVMENICDINKFAKSKSNIVFLIEYNRAKEEEKNRKKKPVPPSSPLGNPAPRIFNDCKGPQIIKPKVGQKPPSRSSRPPTPLRNKPLSPFDDRKIKRQIVMYERLLNDPNYSDVKWLLLSETKTDSTFEFNGKTYYLNSNVDAFNEYDISAVCNGETVYFKVEQYFPPFLKNKGKKIMKSFVNIDDEDNEIIIASNLD